MSNREYLFFILGFYFGVGNMLHFSITRMDKEYKNDKLMRIVIILLCIVWPIFLVCINHHIWLGVTAENQKQADHRIPILLETPAHIRFVSCEPLLEQIAIDVYFYSRGNSRSEILDWVIAGAESGSKMRPCDNEWIDSLVEQCDDAAIPLFVKQIQNINHAAIIKDPSQYPQEMPSAFHIWKTRIEGA